MPTSHEAIDRESLRRAGRALRNELGLADAVHEDLAPGFRGLIDELIFGTLWRRPGLERADRMVATLAALAGLERSAMLGHYASAARRIGIDGAATREIVLQAGLYTGFPAAEANLRAVNGALAETLAPAARDPDADLLAEGVACMESLHGERARGGYAAADAGAPAALYDLAIRYGYGELWNRPGLDRRRRLIVAVAVFTVLEQPVQLAKFSTSAGKHGLDFDACVEVVNQVAPYGGFPRSLNALSALQAAKDEGTV